MVHNYYEDEQLHLAICNGDREIVRMLMTQGVDIEARNHYGDTPLHLAVCNGYREIVRMLMAQGANIYAENNYRETITASMAKGASIYAEDDYNGMPAEHLSILDADGILWKKNYENFVSTRTPPASAKDVYHLLSVYPLKDPTAPIDRETHLQQIFSCAIWKDKEQARLIISQLQKDEMPIGLAESLLTLVDNKIHLTLKYSKSSAR